MTRGHAPAKINLALVVGPVRKGGKHEVATVFQQLELADAIEVEPAASTCVEGFDDDTIVTAALTSLARAADHRAGWRVRIEKRIPVAAGLGGGSSDAATALRLANETLPRPLSELALHAIGAATGADVPFFLLRGAAVGTGDGSVVRSIVLPLDYVVVLALPHDVTKESTGAVYQAFDGRRGAVGFDDRRASLQAALAGLRVSGDLARLPSNDLASSPLAARLVELGAFRADVSGAGPTVYGLFATPAAAETAAAALSPVAATSVTRPLGAEPGAG